jgi:cob(I)alamin adenosyltransferase
MESFEQGHIQVYTGNCKGKTTAALGLAFRAMGHEFKTYIGQFIKKHPYGEVRASGMVSDFITLEQYGLGCFIRTNRVVTDEDISAARNGLARAREVMLSGEYNIVVLDEVLTACHLKLVLVEDILNFISQKPSGVELILTGRYAPQEIMDAADLVTEMKEIKHYYSKGIQARIGIEY